MGDRGVAALATQCRRLQSLNMSGAHRVTDVAIRKYCQAYVGYITPTGGQSPSHSIEEAPSDGGLALAACVCDIVMSVLLLSIPFVLGPILPLSRSWRRWVFVVMRNTGVSP